VAIVGDTIIHTLRGDKRADKLAALGEPFWCFTWTGEKITVGRARLAPLPRKAEVQRLVLDDGTSLQVTPDQLVVHRDGTIGSPFQTDLSLMPLYLGRTTHGYPTYKQMGESYKKAVAPCDRRRVRLVARMVYEWKTKEPIETGMIVRYKDGTKRNCEPDNLRLEGKPHPKRRNKFTALHEAQQIKVKTPNNHKVAGFEPFGVEDVFDISEGDCENLGVGGIFLVTHGPA